MRKKTYRQNCSLAFSADLLGERWTLLIFRELLIRPCRYGELNFYLKGMGSNLLSARLKELEAEGLIEKQSAEDKRSPYRLTGKGMQLEPLVLELIRWGYRYGRFEPEWIHHHHWDLLAMKALFVAAACRCAQIVQFESDQLSAWVSVNADGLAFELCMHDTPDLVIPSTIRDFQSALARGDYRDQAAVGAFVDCFDLSHERE